MTAQEITVAVYDGDPLSRAGITAYLHPEGDLAVIPGADSATGRQPGDVAVMIIDRIDSAAAVRLRKLVLDMQQRVVLVTSELDEPQLKLVLDAGVQTIVWRHQATAERLVKAVRSTSQGDGEVPPDLLSRLLAQLGRMRRGGPRPAADGLTDRELEVLRLVAKGLDTKEMAEQLSYSERTVKGVLHDIMVRLQLKNRAHAVAFAIREGYI